MLQQLEGQWGWLRFHSNHQCSGSMTFWCGSGSGGSGSADPCLWSCYIHHWPSRRQQKTNKKRFSAYYFLKVHLHHFSKIKSQKEVKNQSYFCLMIEVSWSRTGSGSIPLTNGSRSGSKRPKNMWIRWFRIRIRIHNTCYHPSFRIIHIVPGLHVRLAIHWDLIFWGT